MTPEQRTEIMNRLRGPRWLRWLRAPLNGGGNFLTRDLFGGSPPKPAIARDETAGADTAATAVQPEAITDELETRPADAQPAAVKESFTSRLRRGVGRSRDWLTADLFSGGIDADLLEELETRLLTADVGVDATRKVVDRLTQRLKRKELSNQTALMAALREELLAILAPCSQPLSLSDSNSPFVWLMVGVNGVGKTTTIGKLARKYQAEGNKVVLAAGDTFRAAAVEQLQTWGERNEVTVIAQQQGADPAAVIFDALEAGKARKADLVIADTAGRLHTADNLMSELAKIKRVIGKFDASAPHEVMLVIDATTGQNALNQARQFHETVGLTGITITKLDGTAKGGVVFAIAETLGVPIRYVGVGEGIDDLGVFNAADYVDALLGDVRTSTTA